MKIQRLAGISLLLLASLVATGKTAPRSQLESMYDKAFTAFDTANYDEALKALDAIDVHQPDLAESFNLRGVILMRQGKYGQAEAALRKARSIDPKFWNASFNLAEIPFLKKDWVEARNRFEALVTSESGGMEAETSQLIQYKILLTFVLEGKEKTVDWMLNKFELSKDSPALYYCNAAIALHGNNQKEAREWMDAAEKQYPAPLNKLYAESFYEVGWMQKPAGAARPALEITSTIDRAARMRADAKANFEKAERAVQQRDFDGAWQLLDLAEAGAPNDAAANNLRGEILMEQKKFDEAEVALRKASAADPKFREAEYNLALVSFKRGDYATSRNRFEALFGETPGDEKNQAAQLIKFKIFLTLLLEGKDANALPLMDQFKFTGDTPALYYAQAAWEFKHQHAEQGQDWVASAQKIYSGPLNIVFADSFYDLGWLTHPGAPSVPPISALAQVEASPTGEPTPAVRLGQLDSRPAPDLTQLDVESPATVSGIAEPTAVPVETEPAVAVATPSLSIIPPAQPVAKATIPPIAATSAAVPEAAPARGATQAGELSRSTFAEMIDRASKARTLMVGGLLLAGILLLVWFVVQQIRLFLANIPLYESSTPLTEPPFTGDEVVGGDEHTISRDLLSRDPPQVSLQLKASMPSARAAVLPSGVNTAPDAVPGVREPRSIPPSEMEGSIAVTTFAASTPPALEQASAIVETKIQGEIAAPPLCDQKEVPLPAAFEVDAAQVESEALAVPEVADLEQVNIALKLAAAASAPIERPAFTYKEPFAPEKPVTLDAAAMHEIPVLRQETVGQGQPIPELTAPFSTEPIASETVPPEPENHLVLIEPEATVAAPIAGGRLPQSSIESPAISSENISTEPIRPHRITPIVMPETTITTAPAFHTPSPTVSMQQPVGGTQTAVQLNFSAVQLTFSLEIASMQLTPTFEISGLQLRPTSKIVSMRLTPWQDSQPSINLEVTFEVAKIELSGGTIGMVRLAPSAQEKPAVLTSPSFAISGLEFVSGAGTAPVQLTPSHQEQASVQLTAQFQIAAIEFTPLFEIAAIVLNANSRNVSMQLPGSGPSTIDSAPVFEIENVQLGADNELGLIQVTPTGVGRRG